MTHSLLPLLRQAAACASRAFGALSTRFAVIVAIVAAVAGSAHAATPFEVRVTGSGPDVLLIPGLASSGAVWDDTVNQLRATHRCHVFTLAGFAGLPAQPGALLDTVDAALAAYIEQQRLQAPVVIGHSLGGSWPCAWRSGIPPLSASW